MMNPFDLRGPQFLVFYALLAPVVIWLATRIRISMEMADRSGRDPSADIRQGLAISVRHGERSGVFSDPYLIAFLRGGAQEVLRVATISLIDRKLLVAKEDQLAVAPGVTPDHARRRVEREILEACRVSSPATSIVTNTSLGSACTEYETPLVNAGYLPDEMVKASRLRIFLVALGVLGAVSGTKIAIAMMRGRTNVAFLVIMTIVVLLVLLGCVFPRRTARGTALLRDIRGLFKGLKERASTIRPGGGTTELVLLSAVFGVSAVPNESFPWVKKLYPQATSSDSGSGCSSSSCGSSCGGGCGGGCGGCGG